MENLNVKLESLNGTTLTVLQGQALEQKQPNQIIITGDINTVTSFLKERNSEDGGTGLQKIDKSRAIVMVDKKEMSIKLQLDPENFFGVVITGKLEFSDEIKQFSINQSKTFTREELVKLIKFNKLYFSDPDKHADLLKAYQAFSANATIDTKQENDTRGNKVANYAKQVQTNLPTEFILNIPIFKGLGVKSFRVEICLDVTDGGSRFWFESVELHELIETTRDKIIDEQLKNCSEFVVVNK